MIEEDVRAYANLIWKVNNMTRQKLFSYTIKYFNLNNRSVHPNGKGLYSGKGCAIGKHIKDKQLCSKLDTIICSGLTESDIYRRLPTNLQKLGQDFLIDIQMLHDNRDNWTISGLSRSGIRKSVLIAQEYNLICPNFKVNAKK